MNRVGAAFLLGLACVGCATKEPQGRQDLLTSLVDGTSRCPDVVATLGEPSGRYESDRLLTYRIAEHPAGWYRVANGERWNTANYSLIVVCNAQRELEKHTLVRVAGHGTHP
jgi:hypothetical protein